MAAGEWIAVRTDLSRDPAVVRMTRRCPELADEDHTVGKLVRIWAWAHEETADGQVIGVDRSWIDRYLGLPGFAAAMIEVGWLQEFTDGLRFPAWGTWNTSSAKQRLQAARKKHRQRTRGDSRVDPRPASGGTNVPRVGGQMSPEMSPSVGDIGPPSARTCQGTTGPDRTGPDSTTRLRRAGKEPSDSRNGNGRASWPRAERVNWLRERLAEGPPPAGEAWIQRFCGLAATEAKLAPAEYRANRGNLRKLAEEIASRPDREAVGAELIQVLLEARAAAGRGQVSNAWAIWQLRIKPLRTPTPDGGTDHDGPDHRSRS